MDEHDSILPFAAAGTLGEAGRARRAGPQQRVRRAGGLCEAVLCFLSTLGVCACARSGTSTEANGPRPQEADFITDAQAPIAHVDAPPPQDSPLPIEEPGGGCTGPRFKLALDSGAFSVQSEDGATTAIIFSLNAVVGQEDRTWTLGEWQTMDGGWRSEVQDPAASWTIAVEPDSQRPVIRISVEAAYLADVDVAHEELAISISGVSDATVLGRDLRPRTMEASRKYLTDPWTPIELRVESAVGALTLLRHVGFPSAVAEWSGQGTIVARLELDDSGNHPFRPYTQCFESYARDHPRRNLDATPRRAGEHARHAAEVWLGDMRPVRLERLPAGRKAAIVFTSHADQSKVETTRALLWGFSDPSHEGFGTKGLLGHGLSLTLSAFAEDGRNADMGQPDFASILSAAAEAGVEICPHSVTSSPDDRETAERLLPSYSPYAPVTWIDHEPDTNCEAINNSSSATGGAATYDLLDLLVAAGYRYFWMEPDVDPPGGVLNMLAPRRSDYRPTILFRNSAFSRGQESLWLFRTVWMFTSVGKFLAAFDDPSLDRLIAERGIHVAHVYLDTYQERGRLAGRSLFDPIGGTFATRDDVDALWERLQERQDAGALWVVGLRSLATHMTAMADLTVNYQPDGSVAVSAGHVGVEALGLTVEADGLDIAIDGHAPTGLRSADGQTTFWFPLAGDSRSIIAFARSGNSARLAPGGCVVRDTRGERPDAAPDSVDRGRTRGATPVDRVSAPTRRVSGQEGGAR